MDTNENVTDPLKAKANAYARAWKAANREHYNAYQRAYRAKQKQALIALKAELAELKKG